MAGPSKTPVLADSEEDDAIMANAEVLTREEVLKRRSRRLKRLASVYRNIYWALMEDLRRKHREYYWTFGKSPFMEDEERENGVMVENANADKGGDHRLQNGNGDAECGGGKLGLGFGGSFNKCVFQRCDAKAMPLTDFCHTHILYDPKQTLYKRCRYRVDRWSTESGAIQCAKPILRTTIPSLCSAHVVKTEKAIKHVLKKGGLSGSSSAKLASKFQCVITEYVRLIQSRRRAAATKARGDHQSEGNMA